mmetsp:Transcript_25665/g.46336  ORF Transcript_25665/g.46336 Transcript_25665/m.46336 type:complete len:81 (+) Transcript_25665:21-263(+)
MLLRLPSYLMQASWMSQIYALKSIEKSQYEKNIPSNNFNSLDMLSITMDISTQKPTLCIVMQWFRVFVDAMRWKEEKGHP